MPWFCWQPSWGPGVQDPTERDIETNVIAAQALAAACKHQCINRFLYASTCSVYAWPITCWMKMRAAAGVSVYPHQTRF